MIEVRTRFAPSPTGMLHVGGARTALFSWLFARQFNGKFIIRIEDTDQTRYNPVAVTNLLESLEWLGLDWDEGPSPKELNKLGVSNEEQRRWGRWIENSCGPYVQSERKELYKIQAERLVDYGYAYFVFTPELDESVKWNVASKEMNLYRWRNASKRMIEVEHNRNTPYHIRLKAPREGVIAPVDSLRGPIEFRWNKLQDLVLLKTDGMPTYHLAMVVDDNAMEITNVLRGEEWISTFPIHWYLYDCFRWNRPSFTHLPVILNPTGKGKMSKRAVAGDGSSVPTFVLDYKKQGYLPEAMINFMALIGWSYDGETEIMSREELIKRFDIKRIRMTGSSWDIKKLQWMNQLYIRKMNMVDYVNLAKEFIWM